MELEATLAKLTARGIEFGNSTIGAMTAFELEMGLECSDSFRLVYRSCNGFDLPDHRSWMSLWSLEEIIQRNSEDASLRNGSIVAIGDFLIDSDFIVMDVSIAECPASLLFEKREIATGLPDFLRKLVSRRFDFFDQGRSRKHLLTGR